MKDAKDVLRIVGMILLGVFVFMVAVPFVLTLVFNAIGITLGIIGFLIRTGGVVDQGGGCTRHWLSDSCWYSCPATLVVRGQSGVQLLLSVARVVFTPPQSSLIHKVDATYTHVRSCCSIFHLT